MTDCGQKTAALRGYIRPVSLCNGDYPCDNGERKTKICPECAMEYAPNRRRQRQIARTAIINSVSTAHESPRNNYSTRTSSQTGIPNTFANLFKLFKERLTSPASIR